MTRMRPLRCLILDAVPEINENGANQHGFDNIKPSRKNQGGNSAPHHR
jgi:hypothetical protein